MKALEKQEIWRHVVGVLNHSQLIMIDNSKRNTLKSLALTIAATAITKAARAESAWSGNQDFLSNKPSGNSGRDAAELATVQV